MTAVTRTPEGAGLNRTARVVVGGALAFLLGACTRAAAWPGARGAPAAANPPQLVVVITVDQLAQPYLERFRAEFSGGFARLLERGAVFTRAYHDHGITETAPGHAAILSGRYPYSTGIVRNDEGVPDSTMPLVGATGEGASPFRFQGTALLDWLRVRWPETRMLSVSRKNRSAILPVGRSRSGVEVYWFSNGHFTTSRYYTETLPFWVRLFDQAAAPAKAPGQAWTPLRDAAAYPEPDTAAWENRLRGNSYFPHVLRAESLVINMPWMDSLLLAMALEGMRELRLGGGPQPDVVAIGLSTLDATGHEFGPASREVHDHVLRLDRYLGAFLDSLEARYPSGRVLVALTSDHGVTPRPEVTWREGGAADFVPADSVVRALQDTLIARLGRFRWVLYRDVGMVALDRAALTARGVNVDSLADDLAARLRALPGMAQVDTRVTLARADTTRDTAARRWRRMLYPGVPGEVFFTPTPPNYIGFPRNTTHGQATDLDAHVPLILLGPGVRQGVYEGRVAVVDLAPTLARLIGVAPRERIDGRVLREAIQ